MLKKKKSITVWIDDKKHAEFKQACAAMRKPMQDLLVPKVESIIEKTIQKVYS